jgi:prepilin-type N-terminal cleavage/methylation domain-containing protein
MTPVRACFRRDRTPAFTLIEVLVVVAIIALLVAILLPSLARARENARLSVCLSNIRNLATGCMTYATESQGRFPGAGRYTDWLGKNNANQSTTFGRTPVDGTIYRNVGRQNHLYLCPSDPLRLRRVYYSGNYTSTFHSYQLFGPLGGAKLEAVNGAHAPAGNFTRTDHTAGMRPLNGCPLLVEGLYEGFSRPSETPSGYFETKYNSSWWVEDASVANRHLSQPKQFLGASAMAYHDGSASSVKLAGVPESMVTWSKFTERQANMDNWFHAKAVCIRTGNRWASARTFNTNTESYGWLDRAPDPSTAGIIHP